MQDDERYSAFRRLRIAALRIAIHRDALFESPSNYLRCAWWWVAGKRLRARMKLTPALGRSPRAYELWQALRLERVETDAASHEEVSIMALLPAGAGSEETRASIEQEGIEAQIISQASDLSALDWSRIDWILPVGTEDRLAAGAGAHYRASAAALPETIHVVYADDDLMDDDSRRYSPHLKPDWNAELFRNFDYVTGASLLRVERSPPLIGNTSDWAAALTRSALEATSRNGQSPVHIRKILHHRKARPAPILPQSAPNGYRADQSLPDLSVIVPTRNRHDLLRLCLDGLQRTRYPGQLDVIVIDNGSDDPATLEYLAALDTDFATVIRDDGPFNFASLNNRAVAACTSELLCFLNNDIEVRHPDWLSIMAHQAMRDEVGAVGAQLLYPDGLIQHAGVVIGIGGAAAHAHRMLHPQAEGYFQRHSLPQFVCAVTAACMVMRRDRFEAVNGFDEERFAVSFNDVDLCLRLRKEGWEILYEPRASLVHHESVSRGLDHDPQGAVRQDREVRALQQLWHTGDGHPDKGPSSADPFHHPGLSPLSEHFVLRI